MTNNFKIFLLAAVGVINLFAFVYVGIDKRKSTRAGEERVPEVMFFFLATLFGSLGVFLGLLFFRHKTKKFYFMLGIALLLLEQVALLYLSSIQLR